MDWLDYATDNCSIQRSLDVIGEKWTLLVLREAFNGVRRFDQVRHHVGVSGPVLSDRLRKLVAADILKAHPYREAGHRTRHEYRLTAKGLDLHPVVIALLRWGDRYYADPQGPSVEVVHEGCGRAGPSGRAVQGRTHPLLGAGRPRGPGARSSASPPIQRPVTRQPSVAVIAIDGGLHGTGRPGTWAASMSVGQGLSSTKLFMTRGR